MELKIEAPVSESRNVFICRFAIIRVYSSCSKLSFSPNFICKLILILSSRVLLSWNFDTRVSDHTHQDKFQEVGLVRDSAESPHAISHWDMKLEKAVCAREPLYSNLIKPLAFLKASFFSFSSGILLFFSSSGVSEILGINRKGNKEHVSWEDKGSTEVAEPTSTGPKPRKSRSPETFAHNSSLTKVLWSPKSRTHLVARK